MKVTETVSLKLARFPKGYIFTYTDVSSEVSQKEAIIKALNRMVKSGKLAKFSKGKYYKPENTSFGELLPDRKQVVKDLLEEEGKITGYLTGYSIYNLLGLTTQVGNTIQIGKNQIRPNFKRERYVISFIRQKNTITKENIPLLQILDAIRYIKKIPNADLESSVRRFLAIIKNLPEKDKNYLVRLAVKYPPATRAIVGAIFDDLGESRLTDRLFTSINPITEYKLSGVAETLSSARKWNIV
jgi:Family of unknown function (DUF6088)